MTVKKLLIGVAVLGILGVAAALPIAAAEKTFQVKSPGCTS